jgi:hypothetical protein
MLGRYDCADGNQAKEVLKKLEKRMAYKICDFATKIFKSNESIAHFRLLSENIES